MYLNLNEKLKTDLKMLKRYTKITRIRRKRFKYFYNFSELERSAYKLHRLNGVTPDDIKSMETKIKRYEQDIQKLEVSLFKMRFFFSVGFT